jgi:polyisoprenoid-binding protein YceI
MKLVFSFLVISLFFVSNTNAQKVFGTRNGKVSFSSPSDEDNGQVTFSLLIKGFKFKLAEMQEHFNDQYLESTKFPRADFKGNIVNLKDVNFSKDGSYKIAVKGDLTMHGVTKNITVNGTIEIKDGKPSASGKFDISMKDFNVDASKVTEKVLAEISCQYQ